MWDLMNDGHFTSLFKVVTKERRDAAVGMATAAVAASAGAAVMGVGDAGAHAVATKTAGAQLQEALLANAL